MQIGEISSERIGQMAMAVVTREVKEEVELVSWWRMLLASLPLSTSTNSLRGSGIRILRCMLRCTLLSSL
jgi:hypothetical protein